VACSGVIFIIIIIIIIIIRVCLKLYPVLWISHSTGFSQLSGWCVLQQAIFTRMCNAWNTISWHNEGSLASSFDKWTSLLTKFLTTEQVFITTLCGLGTVGVVVYWGWWNFV
jgi:hypothetical protein